MSAPRTGRTGSVRRRRAESYLVADAHHRRGRRVRRRGHPSRLRLPVRAGGVRGGRRGAGHRVRRSDTGDARGTRRQDRGALVGPGQRGAHRARHVRAHRGRWPSDEARIARHRARHRLPGAGQGGGRWRRPGHAPRRRSGRACRRGDLGRRRGAPGVRVRERLPRALRRGRPARRGAAAGGHPRQHRGARGARLLHPAASPEAGRGGAGTRPDPG